LPLEIIYTVFVSSTFEDLHEERGELQKALLKLKCFPIGMELFPSSDDETWEFIKRQIDEADYYIVVIAGKYGSTGPDGTSYTEMEYDYARLLGKPIIAFVHGDPGKLPADKTEFNNPTQQAKLEAFKAKVQRSIANRYTTPQELATQVITSLVDLKDRRPATGFVRADQIIDAKKYADLLEENQRLKEVTQKLTTDNSPFPGYDDEIPVDIFIHERGRSRTEGARSMSHSFLVGELFVLIAGLIIDGQDEDGMIRVSLGNLLARPAKLNKNEGGYFENETLFATIRQLFFARGLITIESKFVSPSGTGDRQRREWRLTDYGQSQYGLMLGILSKGTESGVSAAG
jgi:hypothetical protein